jgi:AcrR family transcriptional regulator
MPVRLPTEERQGEIVTAALRLARDVSPALITTAEIAALVGVSQGALFKHFPSKDAIWQAAMVWIRTELLLRLHQAAESGATPLAALAAIFNTHVGFVASHPGVPRLIFHELQKPSDSSIKQEVRALLQTYRQLLLRLLEAGVKCGELDARLDHEAAATVFVGLVQGLVMQSMAAGKTTALATQAGRVFDLFARGIVAHDAPPPKRTARSAAARHRHQSTGTP